MIQCTTLVFASVDQPLNQQKRLSVFFVLKLHLSQKQKLQLSYDTTITPPEIDITGHQYCPRSPTGGVHGVHRIHPITLETSIGGLMSLTIQGIDRRSISKPLGHVLQNVTCCTVLVAVGYTTTLHSYIHHCAVSRAQAPCAHAQPPPSKHEENDVLSVRHATKCATQQNTNKNRGAERGTSSKRRAPRAYSPHLTHIALLQKTIILSVQNVPTYQGVQCM